MTGPRDDARLDATPQWNAEYQAARDREAEEAVSDRLEIIDPASDELAVRLARIVLMLEDLSSASGRHIEKCRQDHPVRHGLMQAAAGHFERAADEIRKGATALRETK